jgi:hypothetical protein
MKGGDGFGCLPFLPTAYITKPFPLCEYDYEIQLTAVISMVHTPNHIFLHLLQNPLHDWRVARNVPISPRWS